MSEFDLIAHYFSRLGPKPRELLLGVGDDCALIRPPTGMDLALSLDTLVAGRHFLPDVDPRSLGHKALAVNLSDLAAMGATPAFATLALTLPTVDEGWLEAFCAGFGALAQKYGIGLIGGDTTRGPLTISIQVHGWLKQGQGLKRSNTKAGDLIYVSGQLGLAALGLKLRLDQWQTSTELAAPLLRALDWPEPRLALGQAACALAGDNNDLAAIDISDGLGADLGHVCERSGLGARIKAACLPLSPALGTWLEKTQDWAPLLGGGDDYELCISCPAEKAAQLEEAAVDLCIPLTCIGEMIEGKGVLCLMPDGRTQRLEASGFDHFDNWNP